MTDDFFIDLNWNVLVFDPNNNVKFISDFVYSQLSRTQSNSVTLRIDQLNKVIIFQFNFLWDFLL